MHSYDIYHELNTSVEREGDSSSTNNNVGDEKHHNLEENDGTLTAEANEETETADETAAEKRTLQKKGKTSKTTQKETFHEITLCT